jgi:tetratricopeptide (TPR) repeat protein
MGRYQEALIDLDNALESNPDNHWAMYQRAQVYYRLARYEDALRDLNSAIDNKPDESWYRYVRAKVYQALNKTDQARIDFDAALRLGTAEYEATPHHMMTVFNLALYHLNVGKVEEAYALYQEGMSLNPTPYAMTAALRDLEDVEVTSPDYLEKIKALLNSQITPKQTA